MFKQVTGQKDTIHNIFLSNYPVETVSTFSANSAHWRFLIKHALIDPFPIIGIYLYHVISADQSNNWTTSGI